MGKNEKQIGGLLSFLLWLLLMSLALVTSARGEDRALLIGVGRYAHFDEKLRGVSLDIRMMTEIVQLLGFPRHTIKVLEHENASTATVYSAVENWLINGVDPKDRVLFYFSGHGSQIPDENNDEKDQFDEVLLLYDVARTQQGRYQTLTGVLHDDDVNTMLARMPSNNILVILDACHSGSATKSLRLNPRSLSISDAQVKYFSYSPYMGAVSNQGSFDVMEPETTTKVGDRYVAITACRDDEKTVATAQGSIFTLGLRQVVRSAAMAGNNITPEELQLQTTRFINDQIRSDTVAFHPQIAGNMQLRKHPIELVTLVGGNGIVRQEMETLVYKSNKTVSMKLNKSCFEIGDVLEISVWIPEPGYLNIMSIKADDQATVLFPNQYHPNNAVTHGMLTIPMGKMDFELIADDPTGPNLIAAFLTKSPTNSYKYGFKTTRDVLATLSPNSTRSLIMRQKQGWLAGGKITADVRDEGKCR